MRTAFSIWEHGITPLFDTARQIHLAELEGVQISAEKTHVISKDDKLAIEVLKDIADNYFNPGFSCSP